MAEFYAVATRKLATTSLVDLAGWTIHRPAHADLVRAVRLQSRHEIGSSGLKPAGG